MDFRIPPDLDNKLKKIKKSDKQLILKIQRQLELFQLNHRHPSLRLHKLTGNLQNIWSISIDRNIRMLFIHDNEAYFFDIGTHDQVYR